MIDPRTIFKRNVQRIAADHRTASKQLIARLKKMSPAEFLRQPPDVFNRLSLTQYREVVASIAPEVKLPQPTIKPSKPKTRDIGQWWRDRSVLIRSGAITVAVTSAIALGGATVPPLYKWTLSRTAIVRPHSTDTWPTCSRLSQYTDGCVYTPAQDLNWDWVAQQLGMPIEVLKRNNRHQPPQFVVRRAPLIVWRERGRLEN